MKLKYTLPAAALLLLIAVGIYSIIQLPEKKIYLFADSPEEAGDDAGARYRWELKRLADPVTGKIPSGIRREELKFASMLPKLESRFLNARTSAVLSARGPWNMGGRSRAAAVDVSDENILFSGSVNGGLWRSTNGGTSWTRVSPIGTNPAITSLAQDRRTGHTNTWYYTTGEPYGTSASGSGAFYLGNGVYKSVDGGLSWNVLPSTSSGTPSTFETVWDLSWRVVTDRSDTANEILYAAVFGAVFRSINGGANWTLQRGNASGTSFSYFTDVCVTTSGDAYAALSSDGPFKGIWRRTITGTWANITPAAWSGGTYERLVMDISPSNENQVYILAHTPNMGKMTTNYKGEPEWNSLWKYTYISGNGTGAGGAWTDLSANIPSPGDQLGNFNAQGGYNLMVRAHPTDTNIVYIGGTNLYRSTDGFTTSANTTHIGGYLPATVLPHYINYPDNHSDQHDVVFYPSDPYKMLQVNDGGIYRTLNDTAANVVWQDLNTGYVTGQFYTIAIDHGTTPNDIVIGGLQDNGTWFTNNTTVTQPWAHPGWGDGAYCAIDNGHNYYYMSRQEGKTARVQLDANGNVLAFRRMDPIGGNNYQFINPFILDPNNNNRMYMSAGNKIWRNDSLDQIPLTGQWDSISTGWYQLPDTAIGVEITALAACQTPANRLYYGTNQQKVYRLDNANLSAPTLTDITSTQFDLANVNCIAVDPNDGDKALVVFSNYRVYSLFYTSDGGTNWTKAAGNFEEDSVFSGHGSGPSLRWASIVPTANGNVYLVATSVGLYGTNHLNGITTVWTNLSPNEIGYTVVDMIDSRTSDGLVVVGTHGSGVFSTTITDTLPTGTSTINPADFSVKVFPNPASGFADIQFNLLSSEKISIRAYDTEGKLVKRIEDAFLTTGNYRYRFERKDLPAGVYFIEMKSAGKTTVKKIVFTGERF